MATLRDEARYVLDEAREGIAWIAVGKVGRGWIAAAVWPDLLDDAGAMNFDEDELPILRAILDQDPNAILVNSEYSNLGDPETMTLQSLCDALRWQYHLGHQLLAYKISDSEDADNG